MGRGVAFAYSEDQFLAKHAEHKTARELFELHEELRGDMVWAGRSIKSLARRVERLRELSDLGIRDEVTRRKAYYERNKVRRE
jgi:hypothetical protein